MLPARNRRDFDEIPQGAREKLQFVWLERVDDAIAEALEESSPAAVAAQWRWPSLAISPRCAW